MSVHLYRIVVYTDVEGVVLHTAGLFSVMYDVKHFSFQTCYALLHCQGLRGDRDQEPVQLSLVVEVLGVEVILNYHGFQASGTRDDGH